MALWQQTPIPWAGGGGVVGAAGVPGGVTVKVLRRPRIRREGSTQETLGSWAQAEEHEVEGVGLDRMVSQVVTGDAGDVTAQSSTVYAPAAADIRNGDRIIFPSGVKVEVTGEPNREPNMINGWQPPMSVPAEVTRGTG